MYTATAGALKATADRTDVVNKCDMVQQQVPPSGNVKEMQNQQLVKEVAGLPNNETPNRNQSSTAQTGKSKDARESANSQGHLNLQHTTREKEKEAGVYDSKNQEQVKLTKEAEITHETGAHNNAPGNFVAGVQTVSLEAAVMDVDDHTYGGKLTKDDGGTKHTVGDDWKVVRFSGRQGASPGVKNKQQQMSFPDKKDENWTMVSSKTGSPNNTKVQQLEQKQGVVNRSSNKRRSSGVKEQATTPKNIEFSNSFDALSNEQEHVKNKEGKSIQQVLMHEPVLNDIAMTKQQCDREATSKSGMPKSPGGPEQQTWAERVEEEEEEDYADSFQNNSDDEAAQCSSDDSGQKNFGAKETNAL
ncbi:hypothetical protein A4A49_33840 [Nicotiana attenuata]|uniref:Uncharacterized protein n=1 Tax=Nicotiana attenuata TaxID=49451 RepID=A0A1J6K9B1_NICAT|nr:hypothetical protein A4A49_33840 [Nicotiana attenuata]